MRNPTFIGKLLNTTSVFTVRGRGRRALLRRQREEREGGEERERYRQRVEGWERATQRRDGRDGEQHEAVVSVAAPRGKQWLRELLVLRAQQHFSAEGSVSAA